MKTKHTPTPWEYETRIDKEYTSDPETPQYRVYSIAPLSKNNSPGIDYNIAIFDNEQDASFAIRTCNNHEALIEALRNIYQNHRKAILCPEWCETETDYFKQFPLMKAAYEALTNATGE